MQIGGYEILGAVGAGGMGTVYKARSCARGDLVVALKVLKPALSVDKTFIERFQCEARLAARISHPNVVRVYEIGEDRGRYFISSEYVEGVPLVRLLHPAGAVASPLPEARAVDIVRQIARGLRAAHRLGIMHGDIKPGNILVTPEGTAKLSDFGMAWEARSSGQPVGPRHGGTPKYAAPEQISRGAGVDARSDIYSLGATFFEMLAGAVPERGEFPEDTRGGRGDVRRLNPRVSAETAAIVSRMIATSPEERFQDCTELLTALERCGESRATAEGSGDEHR